MKVLITGAEGYVGKSIYSNIKDIYDVTPISRKDLDLTNGKLVISWFKDKTFDVVIHCAVIGGSRLKEDSQEVVHKNLSMYYNLLQCRSKYTKFIHFGSGAELHDKNNPYGLSKHIIRQSILEKDNFFNLRIFGVFDENELDTRFIKANIRRYINKEAIVIYEDKYMDFIYMLDLIKIVNYYIVNMNPPKEVNCSYNTVCTLTRIAQIINDLDDYKVDIKVDSFKGQNYHGDGNNLYIDFIGLKQGIKEVYEKLKK
jgi:nucleoside-diphosphate-sugar epimerase